MTSLCENLSLKEKHVFLDCLAYVLNIDKKLNPVKREYMEAKIKEVCLPAKEINNLKAKKVIEILPDFREIHNIRNKRFILREMILLATADHELKDSEIEVIYKLGIAGGVKRDKIDDLFLWAAKGIEWQIDGIKLIEEDL